MTTEYLNNAAMVGWTEPRSGRTPLMICCANGRHDLAAKLIATGKLWCNPGAVDASGATALNYLCRRDDDPDAEATALALLRTGACNPNHYDRSGLSPIHLVASHGWTRLMNALLLLLDLDFAVRDNGNRTALYYACERGHAECAMAFIDRAEQEEKRKKDSEEEAAAAAHYCAELVGLRNTNNDHAAGVAMTWWMNNYTTAPRAQTAAMMEVIQRLRSILLRRDAAVDTNYHHSDEEEGVERGDEDDERVEPLWYEEDAKFYRVLLKLNMKFVD